MTAIKNKFLGGCSDGITDERVGLSLLEETTSY
jgi:hypothetical protein